MANKHSDNKDDVMVYLKAQLSIFYNLGILLYILGFAHIFLSNKNSELEVIGYEILKFDLCLFIIYSVISIFIRYRK